MGCGGGLMCGCIDGEECIKPTELTETPTISIDAEELINNLIDSAIPGYKKISMNTKLLQEKLDQYIRDHKKLVMICRATNINLQPLELEREWLTTRKKIFLNQLEGWLVKFRNFVVQLLNLRKITINYSNSLISYFSGIKNCLPKRRR